MMNNFSEKAIFIWSVSDRLSDAPTSKVPA